MVGASVANALLCTYLMSQVPCACTCWFTQALQVAGWLPDPPGSKWLVVGEVASLANEEGFQGKLAKMEADLAHVQGQQSPADSALHPLDLLDVKVNHVFCRPSTYTHVQVLNCNHSHCMCMCCAVTCAYTLGELVS